MSPKLTINSFLPQDLQWCSAKARLDSTQHSLNILWQQDPFKAKRTVVTKTYNII